MIMAEIGLAMAYTLYAVSLYEDIQASINIKNATISRLKIAVVIIHCYILVIPLSGLIDSLPCMILSIGGGLVAVANYYYLSKKGW